MPGLDASRLRALADELEAEEAAAQRELADAETQRERTEAQQTIDRLETRIAELEQRIAAAGGASSSSSSSSSSDDDDDQDGGDDDDQDGGAGGRAKRKTRPGRRNGQLYEGDDGVGYVYTGPDEPAVVVLDSAAGDDQDGGE